MPILWRISIVRAKEAVTRGLACGFIRVSLSSLFRRHFLPQRVISIGRAVLAPSKVRVEVVHSWVIQDMMAIPILQADIHRVVIIMGSLINGLESDLYEGRMHQLRRQHD